MKLISKVPFWVIILVSLIFGLICGILLNDFPFVKFNNELKLYEVLNLLLTLTLAILIPFLIKKLIDDNRSIKSFLADEIKNIIQTLSKIESIISTSNNNGSLTQANKDEIIFLFHKTELQMNSLFQQLQLSFPSFSRSIIDNLKQTYFAYERFLTGGEMMLSTFTSVDNRFYREHCTEYSKIETVLKTLVHCVHKI